MDATSLRLRPYPVCPLLHSTCIHRVHLKFNPLNMRKWCVVEPELYELLKGRRCKNNWTDNPEQILFILFTQHHCLFCIPFLYNWNLFRETNKFQSSLVLSTVLLVIAIEIFPEIVMPLYSYSAWPTWSTTVSCYCCCTHSPVSHSSIPSSPPSSSPILLYISIENVCVSHVIPYCFTYITLQAVQ